jgi:selenocysteine lyase/cysteine desulfurase
VLGRRTPATGAGIVSFRKKDADSAEIVRHLRERGIATANRGGWVRTSPHFYISSEEVERMVDALE